MTPGRKTGRFSFDIPTAKWDWDDDVYLIHGYEPGSITPTTQLVIDSKHPEDRARVMALLDRVSATGEPFSISYRINGGDGIERRVVLVGEGRAGTPGSLDTIEGYYVDLTEDFEEELEETAHAAVAASAESRASIEQAKGILMLAYGLEPDAAFAMLRWWSRNRNVKVRDLAARVVEAAGAGEFTDADLRNAIDASLHDLSAHDLSAGDS